MNILIIGAGKMGYSIGSAWSKRETYTIYMVEKSLTRRKTIKKKNKNLQVDKTLPDSWKGDIVLFAVKPQSFQKLAQVIVKKNILTKNYLSIMAGISADTIAKELMTYMPITRIMPNIGIDIALGVNCILYPKSIKKSSKKTINNLFEHLGTVHILKNEKLLNSVTAISGSGPAYVFLFLLVFENISKEIGFSKRVSKKIIYDTVRGALELTRNENNIRKLINEVTSKKGTTEEALKVLEKNNFGLYQIMKAAIFAAKNRADKLSKLN